MMRYIHFAAPFISPFVLVAMARGVWWCAGAPWNAHDVAVLSLVFGTTGGALVVLFTEYSRI